MDEQKRYWKVTIGWRGARDSYMEASAEISFEYARTALEAIKTCAEWRGCPDPSTWSHVEADLYSLTDDVYVRRRSAP